MDSSVNLIFYKKFYFYKIFCFSKKVTNENIPKQVIKKFYQKLSFYENEKHDKKNENKTSNDVNNLCVLTFVI